MVLFLFSVFFSNELNSKMCYSWSEFDKGWIKVMKAVLQVVSHATVRVEGEVTGQIDKGLLVFLGVAEEDEQTDLDTLLANSDIVSCHAPLNDKTYHMMDYEQFCKMKPTAIFINVGRGPIVDEKGLAKALKKEKSEQPA